MPSRVALALNTLTEEGCPTFTACWRLSGQRLLLGAWTNLWTAEEDRHGAIHHDYARDSQILNNPVLEKMQFST
jgi:acyl-[acyl-carrier-protein] desaturase